MDLPSILFKCVWAGVFAAGLSVILTAPGRYVLPTLVCGFSGRLVRDLLMATGLGLNWSTLVATAALVLFAVATVRRHQVSPVVLVCSVLPLGAAASLYRALLALMQLSSAKGEAQNAASLALASNLANAFTVSLAIAAGIGAGISIVRIFERDEAAEV
jgi:uncharacterized membrane protein YjjB (DUF3815 family)